MTEPSVPVILKRVLTDDDGSQLETYFHVSSQGAAIVEMPGPDVSVVVLTFTRTLARDLIAQRTTLADAFTNGSLKFSGDLRAISNLSALLNELTSTHRAVFALNPTE